MNFGPGKLYLNGKLRGECSELVIEVADDPAGAAKLCDIIEEAKETAIETLAEMTRMSREEAALVIDRLQLIAKRQQLTVEYQRVDALNEAFRRLSRAAAGTTDQLVRAWHEPRRKTAQWKTNHYGPQKRLRR